MGKKWNQGNASSEFHANLYPFDCFFLFVCFWIPCICLEWKMHFSKWVQFMHGCVELTCVQISAVWWRCCRLFSKFFTFHRRFYSWSMCIWHPENAIKNISTFILIQWVRLLVYSTIWIMPCIFLKWYCEFNERTWTDVCIYFGNAGTWANIRWNKNALESCSGFDWNEEMEFRLSLSPNVHCAHLNAYSQ